MDKIYLGPVPSMENCAQIGSPDFEALSRRECMVYQRMLNRLFAVPSGIAVKYDIVLNRHDFGTYPEVALTFDNTNPVAVEFAHTVERCSPERWDSIARYELVWFERRDVYAKAQREGRLQRQEVPAHLLEEQPPKAANEATFSELLQAFPL